RLENGLRDVVLMAKTVEHNVDAVLLGNDKLLNGGEGDDLIVGDNFVTATGSVTIVPGGVAVKQSDDTAWQDADWKDSTAADYVEQQSWRIHTALWQIAGLKVGAEIIDAR